MVVPPPGVKVSCYTRDGVSVDIGGILRSLPVKEDIWAMVLSLEEAHGRELQDIREGN